MGTRAKLLTATVALGLVSLYVSHLKRRFRRGACAAVRVFLNEVQKVRQETLTVTWFSRRPMADVGQFAALLDPKVELLVVGSGRSKVSRPPEARPVPFLGVRRGLVPGSLRAWMSTGTGQRCGGTRYQGLPRPGLSIG